MVDVWALSSASISILMRQSTFQAVTIFLFCQARKRRSVQLQNLKLRASGAPGDLVAVLR
jgi:hypothetical protein